MKVVSDWRFNLFIYFVYAFSFVIIVRLFQIQVVNASKYKAQAREQQWQGVQLQARRGNIYTSDEYPVAKSATEYSLFFDVAELPEEFKDPDYTYGILEPIIPNLDGEMIIKAVGSSRRWIKILDGLSLDQRNKIDELKISGIDFEEQYNRFYPEESFMSHILGFVGQDQDGEPVGYYGIEQYYDGDLKGQPGWLLQERSAFGDPILFGGVERIDPSHGSEIHLTIDRNVQYLAEESIESGVKRHGAVSGTLIVMDPKTGAIVAMANYPDYDLKKYEGEGRDSDSDIFRNPAISEIYEPGSVVKPLTVAAALDSASVKENAVYNDTGPRYFSGHKVDNWDGKHHGEETITEILQHSNNLGAAWVGTQVGGEALMEYFSGFGFGIKSGVDLEGEESGIMYTSFPLKDIEIANASFGQGISATPLQVLMAFSVFANDGLLMRPYIVSKIVSERVSEMEPEVLDRPISSNTSEEMTDLLTKAVSGGEAKFFVSKKYNIAGKTGTAQVPVKGGYDENRTNATFVGYFPSYRNFIMLVKLEEPSSPSGYAAETAVPLWMEVAEQLAAYYKLTPDKDAE